MARGTPTFDGAEPMAFADASAWEEWLAEHHDRVTAVWLKVAKKGSATPTVTIVEALDVALCYGWIDGHRKRFDDDHFAQRYSPRRPRSEWSQVNVDKVGALIAAGRMRAPGLAAIEAAQADGRWAAAYPSQRNATIPPDLEAALAGNDIARNRFDVLTRSQQYALFLRLLKARTAAVRSRELERILASLSIAPWCPVGQ